MSLISIVPPSVGRLITRAGPQFLKFLVVGTLGFLADTATVYAMRNLIGIYAAGFAGTGVSLSITWPLNRNWTFNASCGPVHRQLPLYLVTTFVALALNRSVFMLLVTFVPLCNRQPVFAVAAGAISGMFLSFGLNRTVVFRERA